jgi:hypothetical protein
MEMDRPSGFLPSNILNFARHNHFESWSLSSRGGWRFSPLRTGFHPGALMDSSLRDGLQHWQVPGIFSRPLPGAAVTLIY